MGAMVGTGGGSGGLAGAVSVRRHVPGLDRRDEAVSAPRQSLYVARCGGIVVQRFAYFLGGDIQAVIEIDQRVAPKPAHQFLARDHLAGTLQQRRQKLERALLQLYFLTVLAQLALRQVDFENTELKDLGDAVVRVHGSFHLDRAISEFSIRACSYCVNGERTGHEAATRPIPPANQASYKEVPLLRFNRVSKSYSNVPALMDVSFEVERGEFVALVGRSGCGKSTLLHVAGAMDFPTSGEVVLDGVVTSSLGEAALTLVRREKVGFIFQSFQLLASLSVVENVELPLLLARRPRARETALGGLREVEMEDYAARLPYELSGGQMQRVAIARALVHLPALLLADEPTGNLDSTTGDAILQLLRRIADMHRTTILMATHSVEAAAVTDTVVRLRDGRVQEVLATAKALQWRT